MLKAGLIEDKEAIKEFFANGGGNSLSLDEKVSNNLLWNERLIIIFPLIIFLTMKKQIMSMDKIEDNPSKNEDNVAPATIDSKIISYGTVEDPIIL